MIRIGKRIPGGRGLAAALLRRAATVELDWDVRSKSRFDATDSAGRALGVFLPRGSVVRGGDVLVAEDGSLVRVIAAPQPVLVVRTAPGTAARSTCCAPPTTSGNRHVALELQADHLKLEPDHVLADMLRAMHLHGAASCRRRSSPRAAPMRPAARPRTATHDHDHGHDHAGHSHDDRDIDARRADTAAAAARSSRPGRPPPPCCA